jgi:L-gulonolactone oxidase
MEGTLAILESLCTGTSSSICVYVLQDPHTQPIFFRPYGKTIPHAQYWNAYESIMKSYKGRPHWAKAHTMTPEDLQGVYPEFDTFRSLRSQWDPSGLFVNDYIKRHFIGYGVEYKAKL